MTIDPTKEKPLDSWAKFEATYEAEIESSDDVSVVSNTIHSLAVADVAKSIKELKEKVNQTIAPPVALTN